MKLLLNFSVFLFHFLYYLFNNKCLLCPTERPAVDYSQQLGLCVCVILQTEKISMYSAKPRPPPPPTTHLVQKTNEKEKEKKKRRQEEEKS